MSQVSRSVTAAAPHPRTGFTWLPPLLVLTLLVAGLSAGAGSAWGQQPASARGRVTGAIEGAPEGVKLEGTRVVLVQFKLDDKGVPKGEPIQTQTTGADGKYAFADVPIEPRTVYQVGASVGGQMAGSQPFTFPAGEREVLLNLRYPHLVTDASVVRIDEGLVAVEPRRGSVWITEVLHLTNPGQDVVEGVQRPLELELPSGAENLEVIREIQERNGHERLGDKLLVYGNLEPGRTTIAYRYRLPVWLGTVELRKRFPHAVGAFTVLTPEEGRLRLHGQGFTAQDPQTIENGRFSAWAMRDVAAGQAITVRLSGVPVRQEVYLIPTAGFAVLMVGVVVWFLRRRLRADEPAGSA
jgi:hypothetical protein